MKKVSLNYKLSDTFYLNGYKKSYFCNGSDYNIICSRCQLRQTAIFSRKLRRFS